MDLSFLLEAEKMQIQCHSPQSKNKISSRNSQVKIRHTSVFGWLQSNSNMDNILNKVKWQIRRDNLKLPEKLRDYRYKPDNYDYKFIN